MERKYKYFRVEKNSDLYEGILFTEKELKKLFKNDYFTFKHSKFKKVSVFRNDIYFCFGARFSDNYQYL